MTLGKVAVRPYQDSDQDNVAALWRVVFPNDPPWNEPIEFIRRKRHVQPDLFWVAQDGEEIVGTVVAGYDGVRGWSITSPSIPQNDGRERRAFS
jgi:predicted N-acetyltransferase YhbS